MRITEREIARAVEVTYNNLFTSNESVAALRRSGLLESLLGKLLLKPMDDDIRNLFREVLEDFIEQREKK
jgi:hypothetical protein